MVIKTCCKLNLEFENGIYQYNGPADLFEMPNVLVEISSHECALESISSVQAEHVEKFCRFLKRKS